MESDRFDALLRRLTQARSRRGAVTALVGGVLGLAGLAETTAKKRKKKKKKKGASGSPPSPPPPPLSPPVCTPTCAATDPCGDDGCGGSCGTCSGAASCLSGRCVCPGTEVYCGGACHPACHASITRNPITCACCIPADGGCHGSDTCCSGLACPCGGAGGCSKGALAATLVSHALSTPSVRWGSTAT